MLGPRQEILRMSCEGSEIRLRINQEGGNWIVIRRRGVSEPFYRDISESELPEVLAQYRAIKGDSERFKAFVSNV